MRQAITTKYLGPTTYRGARVWANSARGAVTLPFDYELGVDGMHARAAKALAEKLGWNGLWIAGGAPDERGNVYVCTGRGPCRGDIEGVEGSDWFTVEAQDG
ncbi:hypothetical protein [Sphingomonas sp.]|uniref:hypothetical protein n=1 Tax=Sphingomonas sp. TaxID=28214 RepID=UPI00257F87B7|nr:hypothetical protein [Sphingomonas sp.]